MFWTDIRASASRGSRAAGWHGRIMCLPARPSALPAGQPNPQGTSAFASLAPVAQRCIEHDRSRSRVSPELSGVAA
eukprot:15456470-Alexandrium_andersonii.AAC.1